MNAIQKLVCEPAISLGMVWVLALPLFVLALFFAILSSIFADSHNAGDMAIGYTLASIGTAVLGFIVVLVGIQV